MCQPHLNAELLDLYSCGDPLSDSKGIMTLGRVIRYLELSHTCIAVKFQKSFNEASDCFSIAKKEFNV